MSLYRCRYLDSTFNVVRIQGVACENDAEAIEMSRRMSANSGAAGFELWQDERCIHKELGRVTVLVSRREEI
jgi:hypothetical protein